MARTAYYVASTHWDREWYDSFQGFRMRLVSLLDELFDAMGEDPPFRSFVMDGQVIPILDYLEIRPEMEGTVRAFVESGRLKLGPWYVLPDEWLVSGESLVRNLQTGMRVAESFGAPSSRAGFVCDMFGHTGQMPQIFHQLGITGALVWRGLNGREHGGLLNWKAPDGSVVPGYRFGKTGYCTYAIEVRKARDMNAPFILDEAVERLVGFVLSQAKRSPEGPLLLFDGGDHLGIEPGTVALIERANERLKDSGVAIVHGDLDMFLEELAVNRETIEKTVIGELRETGRDPLSDDEQWLIPGVLSSRIRLKQMNAACEDELCLWAEPFSAFAVEIGADDPAGFLDTAWRHLLENHPHDSMCGCSIDQVHRDMVFRFDQSLGISSRVGESALRTIARAAAPPDRKPGTLVVAVFNPTSSTVDEPVDIDIPLPSDRPEIFREFFGYEDIFSFRLTTPGGGEVPFQLNGQRRNRKGFRAPRRKFPVPDDRRVAEITARLTIPPFGYTTLLVEPAVGPVRHSGSMTVSHRSIENDSLKMTVEANGTVTLTDKESGKTYGGLLTFEERADIGDGWYHGLAVNDVIYTNAASHADVALVSNGIGKATLRISTVMNVPGEFDFTAMERSGDTLPLRIVSEVTLRSNTRRVEVATTIDNIVRDHRIRALFPTSLEGDSYLSDSAFDVVERPVSLAADNDSRR
ncbi:MAG: glycoside hydrolase family 38, partial [Candidatus Latescibacteria bacterium]|nr:glycoside hydrolase family 38 [Candidatus Latescibacterota bacterium]